VILDPLLLKNYLNLFQMPSLMKLKVYFKMSAERSNKKRRKRILLLNGMNFKLLLVKD